MNLVVKNWPEEHRTHLIGFYISACYCSKWLPKYKVPAENLFIAGLPDDRYDSSLGVSHLEGEFMEKFFMQELAQNPNRLPMCSIQKKFAIMKVCNISFTKIYFNLIFSSR